jgi:hypothetical protein
MIKMDQEAEGIIYQICRACKKSKPLSEFHRDKSKELGRVSICKECAKARGKQYRLDHKKQIDEGNRKYRLDHKEQIAERGRKYCLANKDQISKQQREYYVEHKEEIAERQKKYGEEHKKEIRERGLKYRLENKKEIAKRQKQYCQSWRGRLVGRCYNQCRRARKAEAEGDGVTPGELDMIIKNQHNKCNMCGKNFCKSRPATIDHIILLSKNGPHTPENIQALCGSCNCKKQAKIMSCFISSWAVLGASQK